jgi:hypothetical protein
VEFEVALGAGNEFQDAKIKQSRGMSFFYFFQNSLRTSAAFVAKSHKVIQREAEA